MWCVRCDARGRFKYAKPRRLRDTDTDAPHLIVWSLTEWWQIDRDACEQYLEPDDERRAVQRRFCDAAGLSGAGDLRAAMIDALDRFRLGPSV